MAIKNFILDTNVLIHNPAAFTAFDDNRVIIPIKVIEELDKVKSYKDERARNAREAARNIDFYRGYGTLSTGARMPNEGMLQVVIPKAIETKMSAFSSSIADNEIIKTVLYIIEMQNKKPEEEREEVIFVTKDLNARIKADALGIKTQDFEKQKVSIDKLYMGYTEIEVKEEEINRFFKEKQLSIANHSLYSNQYVNLLNESKQSQSALSRYDSETNQLLPMLYKDQSIWAIKARNREQRFAFDCLLDDNISIVSLIGQAGTGKTLLALAAGLHKTQDEKKYKKLIVSRPIIPMGKDIGYLPGSKDEKLHYWMQPIFDNLEFIFSNSSQDEKDKTVSESIKYLLDRGAIELEALTYIRGRSISHIYFIIDEAQNLTPHEIKTIISRAGVGTKIVLTGDPYQIDNAYLDSNSNGLSYSVERLKESPLFASVTLTKSERSELAKVAAELL